MSTPSQPEVQVDVELKRLPEEGNAANEGVDLEASAGTKQGLKRLTRASASRARRSVTRGLTAAHMLGKDKKKMSQMKRGMWFFGAMFVLQQVLFVLALVVYLVYYKDVYTSKDGASGKPAMSDGDGHVLGTVAATHKLPLMAAPVLPKDVLRSIDQLHVMVPDAEFGVDVVLSMRVSEIKQINRTAVVFLFLGGKELHIINGVSFLRHLDGTEQVICSADLTCAAFEVETAELAEHYLALAEAELEPHAEERRRRMQTCDIYTEERREDLNSEVTDDQYNLCEYYSSSLGSSWDATLLMMNCLLLDDHAAMDAKLDTLLACVAVNGACMGMGCTGCSLDAWEAGCNAVDGDFTNDQLEEIGASSANNIVCVAGDVNASVMVPSTGVFEMAALASVGGFFVIINNDALTAVTLPALASVGNYFWIWNNNDLTAVTMPALASVGSYFSIWNNNDLTAVTMPALASVGNYFSIYDNNLAGGTCDVPAAVFGGSCS